MHKLSPHREASGVHEADLAAQVAALKRQLAKRDKVLLVPGS
jgi:hypothetical protein